MVELDDKELLLASLKGYLEELRESGVDELIFGSDQAPAAVAAASGPKASGAQAAPAVDAAPAGAAPAGAQTAGEAATAGEAGTAAPVDRPAVAINGEGDANSKLLFVMSGEGFAGQSGTLLARIVIAMGFAPESVFLLSFPAEDAATAGLRPALLKRISELSPEVVVALGETAAQLLLESAEPISRLRGRFRNFQGKRLMATLHPDQLLADESLKREVWNEMKQVMAALGQGQ